MRKAQITMESLLLYGAAILVVLLAIAALMYFGVFSFGDVLPQKCDLSATNVFSCNAYSIVSDTMSIEVENTQSKSVEIIGAEFISDDEGLTTECTGSGGMTITPGKTDIIDLTCSEVGYEQGDRVSGTLQIRYEFSDSELEQTGQGELSIAVG